MKLSIVMPCWNEEEVVSFTAQTVCELAGQWVAKGLIDDYECLFVDDGSTDGTRALLASAAAGNPHIRVVHLSRNFGHQAAMLAGLHTADGDAVVTLDVDLQDPPEVIERMLEKVREGNDVVFGVRQSRQTDTFVKRVTARGCYRLMRALGVPALYDHADFRMATRRAVEALKQFREVNVFLRGIFPSLGFRTCVVTYDRAKRHAGTAKYTYRKLLGLAMQGVTSFSPVPLRLAFWLGAMVFVASLGMSGWVLASKLMGERVAGWASIALPLYLLGGIQMMLIGILGEYVGRIYMEIKHRPPYIIQEIVSGAKTEAQGRIAS